MHFGFSGELHKMLHNNVNEVLQIQLWKPSCPFLTTEAIFKFSNCEEQIYGFQNADTNHI
jgi:hypothetical protein